jgi:periplasmic protein TonB
LQLSLCEGIIAASRESQEPIVVVSLEEYSRQALTAGAIVIAHAVALYALIVVAPAVKSIVVSSPLTVHFVTELEPRRQWEPPQVAVVMPQVLASVPQMPVIETAVPPPVTDRAITVAVQSPPPPAPLQGGGEPKLISAVEYVREPAPRYPPQSRRLKEQGLVVLRVLIDERGNACNIEIENSSGYARLDHAAREAVSRAAFRPYIEGGAPRRALVLIPIEFALNRSAA